MNYSVVVDAGYDLPAELELAKPHVVDLSIIEGENVYRSSEVTTQQVISWLKEGKRLTTSAPSPGEWLKAFKLVEEPIIAVTISSKLSASYRNALIAARMSKKKIYVVDSLNVTIGEGILVYKALLYSQSKDPEWVVEHLLSLRSRIRLYLTVGSMEFLARSGRIPWFVGKVGEMFNIKPVLKIEDGEIKKERLTVSDPVTVITSLVKNPSGPLFVGATEPVREFERLYSRMKEVYSEVYSITVNPVISVHVGPASYGVAYVEGK